MNDVIFYTILTVLAVAFTAALIALLLPPRRDPDPEPQPWAARKKKNFPISFNEDKSD